MTDPPQAPKRRRRAIILASVVVLATLVAWWLWPRGDARFVGKWERVGGRASGSEVLLTTLDLHANGTGQCVGAGPAETIEFHFPWRVEGDTLILGRGRDGWLATLLDELDRFTFTRLGYQQLPVVWRFPIRDVTDAELRLGNDRYPEDRVFRRSIQ